jgi:hypothetical protein
MLITNAAMIAFDAEPGLPPVPARTVANYNALAAAEQRIVADDRGPVSRRWT